MHWETVKLICSYRKDFDTSQDKDEKPFVSYAIVGHRSDGTCWYTALCVYLGKHGICETEGDLAKIPNSKLMDWLEYKLLNAKDSFRMHLDKTTDCRAVTEAEFEMTRVYPPPDERIDFMLRTLWDGDPIRGLSESVG